MSESQDAAVVPPQWTLADRLRKARETAGLEKGELADMIGIARNTVGNYENGHTTPRTYMLKQWAMVTQVPAWWLLGEDPRPGTRINPAGYQTLRLAS